VGGDVRRVFANVSRLSVMAARNGVDGRTAAERSGREGGCGIGCCQEVGGCWNGAFASDDVTNYLQ